MDIMHLIEGMKMSSFEMHQEEEEEAKGPLVEVTLQSLTGLVYEDESCDDELPHNISCAVGFAGSASDMQVSSSFLCGNTGNVVVESQSAVVGQKGAPRRPLVLEWREKKELSQSHHHSPQQQAHLTIRLPERDPKIECMSLSQVNRDCTVVNSSGDDDPPPSLDESETSSAALEIRHGTELRGASVVWSASGAAMPDIIELHVSLLTNQGSTTATLGTAFLVFFGSDSGTTVLDLPIKKPADGAVLNLKGISLEEHAFLRVSVSVTDQIKPKPRIKQFFLQDMQNLEPILQQLHIAAQQEHQGALPDHYPMDKEEEPSPPPLPGASRFFCGSGDLSFKDLLRTLSDAVKSCDDGEGVLHHSDSMGSTIVTTESHGI